MGGLRTASKHLRPAMRGRADVRNVPGRDARRDPGQEARAVSREAAFWRKATKGPDGPLLPPMTLTGHRPGLDLE